MLTIVLHLVAANCCKGRTRPVEVTRLQQPFQQHVASEAASKAISFQFPLFALGMSIQFTEVGVAEFVGEYGKGNEIAIAGRHLITQRGLQVNGRADSKS